MFKGLLTKLFAQEPSQHQQNNTASFQPQKIFLFEPNQSELETIIAAPSPEGDAPGYVYFVQEYMNGTFKIGKTKHIEKRMNLFNVKLPFEHKLIFLIKTGNHHQTEVALHKHFSNKRLEGEWFQLNNDDLSWIKKGTYTQQINQTIHKQLQKTKSIQTKAGEHPKPLTTKQIDYAKTMIKKLEKDYKLMVHPSSLTEEDLKRLSVYFRYKNEGALKNLVKSGVLGVR